MEELCPGWQEICQSRLERLAENDGASNSFEGPLRGEFND
jgi:hypothetical protein